MIVYGDARSGNCLKVKWTAERLHIPFEWVEVDMMGGGTRTPGFLALNPSGQVPTVVLDDGRPLSQSNAIIIHLAEGSDLIPGDAYARARVLEWMFWEQYSHEPYIAVARFHRLYLGKGAAEIDPKLMARGEAALKRMSIGLEHDPFLVGDRLTLADMTLLPYTRYAHEGGFDLEAYPAVSAWVKRTMNELGLK